MSTAIFQEFSPISYVFLLIFMVNHLNNRYENEIARSMHHVQTNYNILMHVIVGICIFL